MQVKDVEFAKAPDFDAVLAAVRALSNLHLLGLAMPSHDVIVLRACLVLMRFLNQLRMSINCVKFFYIVVIQDQMFEIPSV